MHQAELKKALMAAKDILVRGLLYIKLPLLDYKAW
jgi:hypothetical protein